MADRRTLDSAARAVHDKLEAAKREFEVFIDFPRTAGTHTPGPWEVGDFDRNGQRIVLSKHIDICTCRVGNIKREMEANAHLIAAAPDLLAALKALTQDSRFALTIGGNPNAIDALVKQVDTAIAKAEGSGR